MGVFYDKTKKIETVLDKLGITGGKKNTTYTITGIENNDHTIIDIKGNDKYILTNNSHTAVCEYTGKDKYTVSNAGQFFIYDLYGNDTYKLTNIQTTDKEGKIDETKTFVDDKFGKRKCCQPD